MRYSIKQYAKVAGSSPALALPITTCMNIRETTSEARQVNFYELNSSDIFKFVLMNYGYCMKISEGFITLGGGYFHPFSSIPNFEPVIKYKQVGELVLEKDTDPSIEIF